MLLSPGLRPSPPEPVSPETESSQEALDLFVTAAP